jgi:hypothetical protein
MESRTAIYSAIIAIMLLFSGSLMIVYYTQEFDEELSFKTTLNYQELEIEQSYRGEFSYLKSAKGDLGTLKLTNEGVVPQVYEFPRLVGCIDLREGVDIADSAINNYQFNVIFLQKGNRNYAGTRFEIPTGKETEFDIVGEYSSYNVPLSAFTTDKIESISIYKLSDDNSNPLQDPYGIGYNGYNSRIKNNCNSLTLGEDPMITIPLG